MDKLLFLSDSYAAGSAEEEAELRHILSQLEDRAEVEVMADPLFPDRATQMGIMREIENRGVDPVEPSPAVMERLAEKTVLLVHWSPVNRKVMDAAPKLRFIGSLRSVLENIDVACAESRGIAVRHCPGRLTNPIADLTMAFILQANKLLLKRRLTADNCRWPDVRAYQEKLYRPLCMLTVGLVGFGAAARGVARRLSGFGAQVQACDPFVAEEVFAQYGVRRVDLDTVLSTSDIVSLHVRVTEENKGMMGRSEFAKMQRHSLFINTARGDLVDEEALIEALEGGTILGAAMDVFSREPLPEDSPLLRMDNVILTPHIGAVFPGMVPMCLSMLLRQLEDFWEQER